MRRDLLSLERDIILQIQKRTRIPGAQLAAVGHLLMQKHPAYKELYNNKHQSKGYYKSADQV